MTRKAVRTGIVRAAGAIDRHIGARLRARRRELGLDRKQVAQALGSTQAQVEKYEAGQVRVSAAVLFDLCAVLGVTPGELLPEAAAAKGRMRPREEQAQTQDVVTALSRLNERGHEVVLSLVRSLARHPEFKLDRSGGKH